MKQIMAVLWSFTRAAVKLLLFKTMTFLTGYNQRLLQKSLKPHRVKCRTEAVNNLPRPL